MLYIITHEDEHGERHQLTGAWCAENEEAAIAAMLNEADSEDDGRWHAYLVADPNEIIEPLNEG